MFGESIKPGEVICDKCNGDLFINIKGFITLCPMCHGQGQLDWIENITGKPPISQYEADDKVIEILERSYRNKRV